MILLADKPQGRTSNDVVQYLKHRLKAKKCGHAGTLDPMATGLMILATDDDTKKLFELTGHDKSYIATIDLSALSDTRDKEYREQFTQYEYNAHGLSISGNEKKWPTDAEIAGKLRIISTGLPISMPLPPFSAKKVAGKKRYDLARSGDMEIVDQDMIFRDIKIIDIKFPLVRISCHVASGTYIRSLAYWLGKQLGTGGILVALQRISIGSYTLNQVNYDINEEKVNYGVIEN